MYSVKNLNYKISEAMIIPLSQIILICAEDVLENDFEGNYEEYDLSDNKVETMDDFKKMKQKVDREFSEKWRNKKS